MQDGCRRLQRIQEALGRIEKRQIGASPATQFNDASFASFHNGGEDGLIQYLIDRVPVPIRFLSNSAWKICESNTRYLAINDCWSGLVMDGSAENIDFIQHDTISWHAM